MSNAASLNDEFNKKLVEKGGAAHPVPVGELPPQAARYLENQGVLKVALRPASGKKLGIRNGGRMGTARTSVTRLMSSGDIRSMASGSELPTLVSTPRMMMSPRESLQKLPPPPLGKTMGHGVLAK